MKKQEFNKENNSLVELLKSKFPSRLTQKIELDNDFFNEARHFSSEILDFGYYPELERIVSISKVQGMIKKIDVSKNEDLLELTFPNQQLIRLNLKSNKKLVTLNVSNNQLTDLNLSQNSQLEHLDIANNEITGIWSIERCSRIKFLACQNNYLNELRADKILNYLLVNSEQIFLKPQKHNRERISPIKNITYVSSSLEKNKSKNNTESQSKQINNSKQHNWKSFYRWLQTEIIEVNGLQVKLKSSQKTNYSDISENALNRFVNSLEATLDNNSFFHFFPKYDDKKTFEELFDPKLIFCGKKTDKKRIGEVSYKDLKKLFYNWKENLNQNTSFDSDFETKKTIVSQATSDKIRNILLVGRTGSGKSTLANVISEDDKFKESLKSISETKNVQAEKFSIKIDEEGKEKIDYQIIDTIGFGDTKLSNKEVLRLLQDLVPIIGDNGLNQILFVTDGRFTEKEIETYKLLETVIFDKKVSEFTTIVRTRFPEFEDVFECEEDRKVLREENEEIFSILKTSKIIYTNNPPLIGRSLEKNKEIREESRKRLLTYLATCQNIYYPANLAEFKQRIDNYQTKSEQLARELAEKEEKIKEQEEKFQNDIQATQTKQQIDLEVSQRKFEQKLKSARNGYDWKLKYAQEQLENKYQEQLKNSQKRYEQEQNEAETRRKIEVNQIESEFKNRKVKVGEAFCSQGHSNVKAYNKYGNSLDPDDFDDTISYVYCSICEKNDYNYEVKNATIYNFEEWCKMRNQSYTRELEEMNQKIQAQEKKKQEILSRIDKERKDRNLLFQKNLEEQKKLQEQIINQEKKVNEEMLNYNKLTKENNIASESREKINLLNKELVEKKQKLENLRRQTQLKREVNDQEFHNYIEQLSK